MDNRQDIEGVRRFQWIRYAGGVDNLDASIPLALGFIDSDEWELVCSDRDRGAWKEADEFSTMALVRALRMIEEWSESEPGGDYDPNSRESSLRRKVQRKLERMSEDPPLMSPLTPGHWRVRSKEYKNYCRMRFKMSKRMDDSWSFPKESSGYDPLWEVKSKRTKISPHPRQFQMAMHHDARAVSRPDQSQDNLNEQFDSAKMQALIEQVKMRDKMSIGSSSQLYRSFLAKRHRESRNSAHFSWERKLNHRFRRLTVGNRYAGSEIWHLDLDSDGETTKGEPGEREWPLKSIPEPARDEEGRFEIGSKKMKWRIHVSILEIMTKVGEDRNLENRPWISRGVISDALLESGEEKTEGRISQVLGDLVGLGIIEKKSDKDDGRIKLYRVKDGALLRKQKNKYDLEEKRDQELREFMRRLDAEKEEERKRFIEALEEIQSIG